MKAKKPTAAQLNALKVKVIKHHLMMAEGFLSQYEELGDRAAIRSQKAFLANLEDVRAAIESDNIGELEDMLSDEF